MEYKLRDFINYPNYDIAWISLETSSSYGIVKTNECYTEKGWSITPLEFEWILKKDFNYPVVDYLSKFKKK